LGFRVSELIVRSVSRCSRADELKTRRDLDTIVFVVTHMIEALPTARCSGALPGFRSPPPKRKPPGDPGLSACMTPISLL
jgi:hypothetical protein